MSVAISHEINQPLVAIKNYALAASRRLAEDATGGAGKVEELLDKIGGQASLRRRRAAFPAGHGEEAWAGSD
jgi:C4-dicarboxylate-specific signal transduction histidine kinase